MNEENDKIIFVAPTFHTGHKSGGVYHPNGIAPCLLSNHGEVIRVILTSDEREDKDNRSHKVE